MAAYEFASDFANINNALSALGKQNELAWQRDRSAQAAADFASGNYAGAAGKLAALGQFAPAATLAQLGQTQKQEADWLKANAGILGGGAASAAATPAGSSDYFARTRSAESSGDDTAKNPRSTATGRYQFLDGTWAGLMKSNPELGLTADGRGDPQQQERAMRAFTAQNADALRAKGIDPSDRNLYLAHFLGAGAAPNFISAVRQDPTVPAASLVDSRVAAANKGVFFNNDGTPKSAGDVYEQMTGRFGDGSTAIAALGGGQPVQVAQADVPAPGAANAQGFVVPGSGEVVPQSIANDPRVLNLQRALAGAPEKFKPSIQSRLNILVEELKATRQQNAPTDVQRNYAVAKSQGYQGSLLDYQKELRAQTTIKNEGQIPPGYRAVRDANGNLERVEPIPGSKAAQEAEVAAEKKIKSDRIKGEVGTTVGNALDDIDRLMKSATLPTTGAMGARVANIPGTAAYDISQALTTIGANISFAQSQQMREASPTGGALGAVSDNEQRLLQNSYAALSQSQSDEQFRTNLGRVRAVFERIVHGRTLTPQERKTGGPMTVERAKGLRDEAAAAIAGGAPRDAVMKRLKEDYGITGDGL